MFGKRRRRQQKQLTDQMEALARHVQSLTEATQAIKNDVQRIQQQVDALQTTIGRQSREAGKATLVFENRAQLLDDALAALQSQAQHAATVQNELQGERERSETQSQLVAGLLPLLDGIWAAALAAQTDVPPQRHTSGGGAGNGSSRTHTEDAHRRAQGLLSLHQRGEALLAAWGVHPIAALDRPFDPRFHRVMEIVQQWPHGTAVNPAADNAGQWVVGEWRRGYTAGDTVLRFADVVVWQKEENSAKDEPHRD